MLLKSIAVSPSFFLLAGWFARHSFIPESLSSPSSSQMGVLFLLLESASGYALLERVKSEEIGSELDEVQSAVLDWSRFSKIVKLKAFCPFTSAQSALENINAITEGEVTEFLANFLEMNIEKKKKVKEGKKDKSQHLGVIDPKLGNMISESLSIKCQSNEMILELIRGCRFHFTNLVKLLKASDMAQAQLGLGHSYSRSKVKFNVHRVDNMIIQSIVILDTIDKDLNTFTMRVREWYSWHFPELIGIVNDNYKFCRLCKFIKQKESISEDSLEDMEKITDDMETAKAVLKAARSSMGAEISPIDLVSFSRMCLFLVVGWRGRGNQGFSLNLCSHVQLQPH